MTRRHPRQSYEWTNHEHVAAPLHVQARRLIEQAGSPELARQAIDAAARAILKSHVRDSARPDKLSQAAPAESPES